MLHNISARTLRHAMNMWPPYLFTGVHVRAIADDWRSAEVWLRMRPWNRNYVGTHFGGSLFAMSDPFWMLLVIHALGPGYIVWDKAGTIEFVKPGRGTLTARFLIDNAAIDEIRLATLGSEKYLRWFETEIVDETGATVALVRKQLYIRRQARG